MKGFFHHDINRINFTSIYMVRLGVIGIFVGGEFLVGEEIFIALKNIFLVIFPEVSGVIIMSYPLAEITEEKVKTVFIRMAWTVRTSQTPFANSRGVITGSLEKGGYSYCVFRNRSLSFQIRIVPDVASFSHFVIIPNIGMSGV